MKIGVFVEYDDAYAQVAALTVPVMQEYCNRHGYDLILRQNPKFDHDRGIIWDRVQILKANLNNYDWLVHMDTDVLITNLNIPLTEFCDRQYDIILSENVREDGSIHLNDGVLFVNGQRSQACKFFLEECWHLKSDSILCAQDALEELRKKYGEAIYLKAEPQKRFNSFLYQEYGMPTTTKGQWTKGDFALHLPGIKNDRRAEIFRQTEIIR